MNGKIVGVFDGDMIGADGTFCCCSWREFFG